MTNNKEKLSRWAKLSSKNRARWKFGIVAVPYYFVVLGTVWLATRPQTSRDQAAAVAGALAAVAGPTFLAYRLTMNSEDQKLVDEDANRIAGRMLDKEVADESCDFPIHRDAMNFVLCFEEVFAAHAKKLRTESYRLKPMWAKFEELREAFPEETSHAWHLSVKKQGFTPPPFRPRK